MYWNLYSYLHLSQVIIFIFLFFLVFLQKSRTNLLKILFIILFNIFAWKTANLFSFSHDKTISVLAAKISLIFAYFIPAFFYLFVDVFLNPQKKLIIKNILLIFLPTLLFIPFSFGELNISSIYFDGRWKTVDGPIYAPFILYFMLYFGGILGRLIKKYFDSTTHYIQKQQIFYIVIGTFLSTSIGIITQGILPLILKNNTDYPLRSLAPLPFGLFLTFAILRYRFIGMKVIFRKGLVNLTLLTIVLVLAAYLFLFLEKFSQNYFQISEQISTAIIVILISFSFPVIQAVIKRIVHRFIEGDAIDFGEEIDLLQESLINTSEVKSTLADLSNMLEKQFNISSPLILIADPKFKTYMSGHQEKIKIRFKFIHGMMHFIKDTDRIFSIENLRGFIDQQPRERKNLEKYYSTLLKLKTELVVPIAADGVMIGVIFLPRKNDGNPYTLDDYEFFKQLIPSAYQSFQSLIFAHHLGIKPIFQYQKNDEVH